MLVQILEDRLIQAEKAFRQSAELYRSILENARDAIYVTTCENEFVEFNQTLALESLFDVASLLAGPGEFAEKCRDDLDRLAQSEWVTLRRLSPETGDLELVACAGPRTADSPPLFALPRSAKLAYAAVDEGKTIVLNESANSLRRRRKSSGWE